MASSEPAPRWQPLSQLPLITWAIDGMADSADEQLVNLRQVEDRPYVLDNATVARLIAVFTQQRGDLWLYTEQIGRWRTEAPSAAQRTELDRLDRRLVTLTETIDTILAMAERLKAGTVEATLAKSDLDLGLEALGRRTTRGRRSGNTSG